MLREEGEEFDASLSQSPSTEEEKKRFVVSKTREMITHFSIIKLDNEVGHELVELIC
jgi:hypothetical protein